jgi:hypothetical protein
MWVFLFCPFRHVIEIRAAAALGTANAKVLATVASAKIVPAERAAIEFARLRCAGAQVFLRSEVREGSESPRLAVLESSLIPHTFQWLDAEQVVLSSCALFAIVEVVAIECVLTEQRSGIATLATAISLNA